MCIRATNQNINNIYNLILKKKEKLDNIKERKLISILDYIINFLNNKSMSYLPDNIEISENHKILLHYDTEDPDGGKLLIKIKDYPTNLNDKCFDCLIQHQKNKKNVIFNITENDIIQKINKWTAENGYFIV